MSQKIRKQALDTIRSLVAELRESESTTISRTWNLAYGLVDVLLPTYEAGPEAYKGFVATAATEIGRGEKMVQNLVRAVRIQRELTDSQRSKTDGWAYDAVLALAVSEKQANEYGKSVTATRSDIIGKSKSGGISDVRDAKRKVLGTSTRVRSDGAAATAKLAEAIREMFVQLTSEDGDGFNPLAILAGAQLAEDHGSGTADAILHLIANPPTEEQATEEQATEATTS